MINGFALNSQPLNGTDQSGSSIPPESPEQPTPPTPIEPGNSFVWTVAVRINGEDVTSRLTGQITIDREEGAAGLATFSIQLSSGPVVPTDWIGRNVEIDFLFWRGDETRSARRYTGQISDPTFDPFTRVISFECTDSLQKRVEAMSIADIDALVGGLWSSDVFEVTEGRSHWDYASERLSTRPVSLDASPYGELRVTEWAAAAPAFIFGAGSTIYGSTSVELAQLDNLTNVVVIEGGYRFPRLWQENNTYSWTSPQMGGHTMIGPGFCEWRTNSTELPTKAMVSEALTGSGQTLIGADWLPLPDSHPDPCDTGAPWINTFYPELLLGFTVNAARRWTQQVTEQYSIRIEATASVAQAGEQITRERLALQIENDQAEAWESDPITEAKPGGAHDLVDEVRREAAINVLMNKARTTILGAHRDTKVRIEVPAPMVVDVDLIHTLRVDDAGIKAVGKCSHIEDTFDMTSGEAVTQITLSVQRGGDSIAVNDPLVMPPLTPLVDPPTGNTYAGLSTQLSGRSSDPPFDEDLDGFSGSFDSYDPGTPERYPRRVKVTAPEIDEARRNEHVNEVPALIRISIPNDTLEL